MLAILRVPIVSDARNIQSKSSYFFFIVLKRCKQTPDRKVHEVYFNYAKPRSTINNMLHVDRFVKLNSAG